MQQLVLAAFEPELEPLRRVAGAKTVVSTCGVGLADAAANTAWLLRDVAPERVLFVGSVGSLTAAVPLLSLVYARAVMLGDPALLLGESYLPSTTRSLHLARENVRLSNLCTASGTFYTPLSITRSPALAERFAQSGAIFENLELFGVAAACAAKNIPWNAVSVVTNAVGPAGHEQWKENFSRAAEITADALAPLV